MNPEGELTQNSDSDVASTNPFTSANFEGAGLKAFKSADRGYDQLKIESAVEQFLTQYKNTETSRFSQVSQEMSFSEYISELHLNPQLRIRNISQYIADAFEFYGSTVREILGHKILDFNVRNFPWIAANQGEKGELVGQEIPTYEYYKMHRQAGQRERMGSMILGFGPPGSGKSLFFAMRDEMLEDYSRNHPEGALYKLVWCFSPQDLARIGFRDLVKSEHATLDSNNCLRIAADNNTDPFFVVSNERCSDSPDMPSPREMLLESVLSGVKDKSTINCAYFLSRGLDTLSQSILEGLLRFYRGDMSEILTRHVRVERWDMSTELGRGVVSIEANPDPNSNVRPVFPENPWEQTAIPKELNDGRELQRVSGLFTGANRGVAHFCDMLRLSQYDRGDGDLSRFNFLLEAVEGGKLQIFNPRDPASMRKVRTNIAYSGDCNADDLVKRLKAPGFDALRERIHFLCFGLPVRFLSEVDRYKKKIETTTISEDQLAPNALETFALFVVATRLLKPDASRGEYRAIQGLPEIIKDLTVVEKALLLEERNSERDANLLRDTSTALSQDNVQLLRKNKQKVADEYTAGVGETRFTLYDGGMGISVRSALKMLERILDQTDSKNLTCIDVMQYLEDQLSLGFSYYEDVAASKRQYAAQAQAHLEKAGKSSSEVGVMQLLEQWFPICSPEEIVADVGRYARKKVELDIASALGLNTPDSARELVVRYGYHAAAFLDPGNFKVPPAYRESRMKNDGRANEEILRSFEDECTLNRTFKDAAARKAFREEVISEIGSWSSRNKSLPIEKHFDQALSKLIEEVEKAQRIGRDDLLKQFLIATRSYCGGGMQIELELKSLDPQRAQAAREWFDVFSKIKALGYPEATIAKHIEWALSEKK